MPQNTSKNIPPAYIISGVDPKTKTPVYYKSCLFDLLITPCIWDAAFFMDSDKEQSEFIKLALKQCKTERPSYNWEVQEVSISIKKFSHINHQGSC